MVRTNLLIAFLITSLNLQSQSNKNNLVGIHFTNLLHNELKCEYGRFIKPTTLIYSSGQIRNTIRNDYRFQDIDVYRKSFGLSVGTKFFTKEFNPKTRKEWIPYVSFEAYYETIKLNYYGVGWVPFIEDNIELYELQFGINYNPVSNRFGILPTVGVIQRMDNFFTEFYWGTLIYHDFIRGETANYKLPWNLLLRNSSNVTFKTGIKLGLFI